MPSDKGQRLLARISEILARDTEYPLDGTLLFAEVDTQFVAPSIFKDCGNYIQYRDPDLHALSDALLDLWEDVESGKRWEEIEYVIRGGRFEVNYTFSEDIDHDEDTFVRRDRIVAKYFGGKPILYPDPPSDDPPLDDGEYFFYY